MVHASFASPIRWQSSLRTLSITSSHDDTRDYASSASPMVPDATLEMYTLKRHSNNYDVVDDEGDKDGDSDDN